MQCFLYLGEPISGKSVQNHLITHDNLVGSCVQSSRGVRFVWASATEETQEMGSYTAWIHAPEYSGRGESKTTNLTH